MTVKRAIAYQLQNAGNTFSTVIDSIACDGKRRSLCEATSIWDDKPVRTTFGNKQTTMAY